MNLFSVLSLFAFVIYLYIGIYALKLEKKAKINRMFFFLCVSMAIWSFAYAFVYVSDVESDIWIKISAIGWCSFSALILHLVLLITENRAAKNAYIICLIYAPGVLFFYISAFMFWPGKVTPPAIQSFFYTGDFTYHFTYLLMSILLVYLWGRKTTSVRKRKQSQIIVISSITPFTLNLLTQTILPAVGIEPFPLMGQLYSLIMIFGIYYAVIKYRLFTITSNLFSEKIMSEMMDLVIVLSPEGKISSINRYTETLLEYKSEELINKTISTILAGDDILSLIEHQPHSASIYRYKELNFIKKNGSTIPASITCSLVVDPLIKDLLGVIIVGQDITLTKELEQEIIVRRDAEAYISYLAYHDNLTNLPNRKFFYEKLDNTLKHAGDASEKFAVFFLDLDNFKAANDNFGHDAGDFLLCEFGRRIKRNIRERDMVARIGGDEFLILIQDIEDENDAENIAVNLLKAINTPIAWNEHVLAINASIGISVFPDHGTNAADLVNKADKNMYIWKKERKIV